MIPFRSALEVSARLYRSADAATPAAPVSMDGGTK
jgi:hypothetical protein